MEFKQYIDMGVAGLLSVLWFDLRSLRKTYMTKRIHDEMCGLKLEPIKNDISEIKTDIKELLKRNGGSRQGD